MSGPAVRGAPPADLRALEQPAIQAIDINPLLLQQAPAFQGGIDRVEARGAFRMAAAGVVQVEAGIEHEAGASHGPFAPQGIPRTQRFPTLNDAGADVGAAAG